MGDDGPIADHDDRGKLPDKSHEARKGKPAAPHDGSGLDHVLGLLTSRITGIGAVLAALVVLNNAITSLTDEVLQRSKAFRERAAAEETFWTGMFTQFLDAAAVGDKDQRNKKFEVIRDMVKLKE
ncbi:MAG TPA: hypothetical protein VG942_00660, partial [Hyphomonadaceae bacterium]|nr:hypothetical protein [Hyphomonadaceae bacterium]